MTPDAHPLLPWLTPERRAWLYRLVSAAMPLLVLYGVAAEHDVAVWLGVAAAFLGTGTAALHTPTRIVQEDADDGQSAVTVLVIVVLVLVILKLIGVL